VAPCKHLLVILYGLEPLNEKLLPEVLDEGISTSIDVFIINLNSLLCLTLISDLGLCLLLRPIWTWVSLSLLFWWRLLKVTLSHSFFSNWIECQRKKSQGLYCIVFVFGLQLMEWCFMAHIQIDSLIKIYTARKWNMLFPLSNLYLFNFDLLNLRDKFSPSNQS